MYSFHVLPLTVTRKILPLIEEINVLRLLRHQRKHHFVEYKLDGFQFGSRPIRWPMIRANQR